MKKYFFCGLIAALLFPFVSQVLVGAGFVAIMFSDAVVAAGLLLIVAFNAILALLVSRELARHVPRAFENLVVRLGGAVLAGILFVIESYLMAVWTNVGPDISLGLLLSVLTPSFMATWIAYWVVGWLVKPIAPTQGTLGGKQQ